MVSVLARLAMSVAGRVVHSGHADVVIDVDAVLVLDRRAELAALALPSRLDGTLRVAAQALAFSDISAPSLPDDRREQRGQSDDVVATFSGVFTGAPPVRSGSCPPCRAPQVRS
jgi:hypothetical protein